LSVKQKEIIRIEGLSKSYNFKTVLDRLDLSIYESQSIAFVGHNGCGKSTLLKLTARLIRPDRGQVVHRKKLLFHYVPEHFPKMNITARQYLTSMGLLDGLTAAEINEKIEELSAELFMADMISKPMKNLSRGTLQKVGVIQALLSKPQLLLLDEPLSGQDMDSQAVFIDKVNELRKQGVTVLMSCHEQHLIERVSDTVYRIENGRIVTC